MSKYNIGDKVVMKIISADQDEIKTYSVSGVNNDWRWCLPQNLLERYIEPLSTYAEPLERKNENKQKQIEKLVDKLHRQAEEITRLLAENEKLKKDLEYYHTGTDICDMESARIAGQNEAWELAKKIVGDVRDGGYSPEELGQIFRYAISQPCITENTYQKAAAKVAEWEKAKEEIEVGDIVRCKSDTPVEFCVTEISCHGRLYGIGRNGGTYSNKNPKDWEKTGRHIDIDSFLKQIGGKQE